MPERTGTSSPLSPEARTRAFFAQPLDTLFDQFLDKGGMVIAVPDSERKIRVAEAELFPKVGARWKALAGMEPGTLWNPGYFRITQSLVAAEGDKTNGSCVRLLRAEYFDAQKGVYVADLIDETGEYHPDETHISMYLGLKRNDRSRLAFTDGTNILKLLTT